MIQGLGVDIIEIARVQKGIEAWGAAFLNKIFTDVEIRYCSSKKDPYQHFAARFAAKEAVSKALATGWRGGFRWKDVEVVNSPSGEPRIVLYRRVAELLSTSKVFLSLSHSKSYVVACAVIESAAHSA